MHRAGGRGLQQLVVFLFLVFFVEFRVREPERVLPTFLEELDRAVTAVYVRRVAVILGR